MDPLSLTSLYAAEALFAPADCTIPYKLTQSRGRMMADELVPDDLREFILRHVDSVAELEALLLLRANASQDWDLTNIAKRLHTGERDVAEGLARLCQEGFLTCQAGVYRYGCHAEEQRRMVDRLSEFYARHLIPVTNIIHGKPRRIREFADAFKFRRDS